MKTPFWTNEFRYHTGALCKLPWAQFPRLRQCRLPVPRTREHRHAHNLTIRTQWVTSRSMASSRGQFLSFLPPLPLNLKLYIHSLPCYNPLWLVSPHISKGDKDEKDKLYARVQTSLCILQGEGTESHLTVLTWGSEWSTRSNKYRKWSRCKTNSFLYAVIRLILTLNYIVNSRLAWATGNSYLKQNKTKQKVLTWRPTNYGQGWRGLMLAHCLFGE